MQSCKPRQSIGMPVINWLCFPQIPVQPSELTVANLRESFLLLDSAMCFASIELSSSLYSPKPYYEYFVSTFPQSAIEHKAHLPDGSVETIPVPPVTEEFQRIQTSYEPRNPVDLASYGPTEFVPLGYVVHARSGDKGSDANVGFYVRHADEWDWLRSL